MIFKSNYGGRGQKKIVENKFNSSWERGHPRIFENSILSAYLPEKNKIIIPWCANQEIFEPRNKTKQDSYSNYSHSEKCHYDHQYDNKVYVCRLCHESGKEVIVIPKTAASSDNSLLGIVKYTYSGYVLECPHHGIIFRSRQYWYGNPEPESVVRTELKHIWTGQQNHVGTSHNLSRKIIDNVSYIGESIHSVSAKPTQIAKQWMADQVAPSYWTPNSDLIACSGCAKPFVEVTERKHHCRGCGKGFCDKCSTKRKVIPWWSATDKVRVCDVCCELKVIPEPEIFQTTKAAYYADNKTVATNTLGNSFGSFSVRYLVVFVLKIRKCGPEFY